MRSRGEFAAEPDRAMDWAETLQLDPSNDFK